MNVVKVTLCLTLLAALGGCSAETGTDLGDVISSLDEGLGLISCERPVPARGLVCIRGFWSTGDRCSSDRQCRIGSACLAPLGNPHCFLTRPDDGGVECPRGSVPPSTPILCAPGFEHTIVTRDGCQVCAPIEDDCNAAERCLTIPECISEIVGPRRARRVLARAEAAGLRPLAVLEILACGGDETRPGVRPRPTRPEPSRPVGRRAPRSHDADDAPDEGR